MSRARLPIAARVVLIAVVVAAAAAGGYFGTRAVHTTPAPTPTPTAPRPGAYQQATAAPTSGPGSAPAELPSAPAVRSALGRLVIENGERAPHDQRNGNGEDDADHPEQGPAGQEAENDERRMNPAGRTKHNRSEELVDR